MFFDSVGQIVEIAQKNGTSIFVVPSDVEVEIPNSLLLEPVDKDDITIEQVRRMISKLGLKQRSDFFVVIRPADRLGLEAANALLKNLEEPGEKIHYVLITNSLSRLLPTILSRSVVYFLKDKNGFNLEITADEETKNLAKKLIAGKSNDLVAIAEKISKSKTARSDALDVLALAIEMLYKSYFITGNHLFAKRIPRFIDAYENIHRNGHVKLHIVADLC